MFLYIEPSVIVVLNLVLMSTASSSKFVYAHLILQLLVYICSKPLSFLLDNSSEDQREPHKTDRLVSEDELASFGVLHWNIDVSDEKV